MGAISSAGGQTMFNSYGPGLPSNVLRVPYYTLMDGNALLGGTNRGSLVTVTSPQSTVSFHNFKSRNFKLSVSNPKSKCVACLSVLSQISNCKLVIKHASQMLRSVFNISCLFLRPRPWQFEILDSTDKQATHLLLGFETLNLKFCDLKL